MFTLIIFSPNYLMHSTLLFALRIYDNYEIILKSLFEMSQQKSDTGNKARNLYVNFLKSSTLLGCKLVLAVTTPLSELNRVCQAENHTVAGILEVVETVKASIKNFRNEDKFKAIFSEVIEAEKSLGLDSFILPRFTKPPKRYDGNAPPHEFSIEEYYRKAFFQIVDTALVQLNDRFSLTQSGFSSYKTLEYVLLNGFDGEENSSFLDRYPELNIPALKIQLPMFLEKFKPTSVYEAKLAFRKMNRDVILLFDSVECLLRLLLVCPVTSCEAERSFSCLRRLKTWIRNTISQTKLNYSAICHVHKDYLNEIDAYSIARIFASRSEIRRNAFGNFPVQ